MSLDLRMDGVGWNVNVILSGSKAEFVKTFESDTQYPDLTYRPCFKFEAAEPLIHLPHDLLKPMGPVLVLPGLQPAVAPTLCRAQFRHGAGAGPVL